MLVLSRKLGEGIIINGIIAVSVERIEGNQIRLGIEAPRNVPVLREELLPRARRSQERRPAKQKLEPSTPRSRERKPANREMLQPGTVIFWWHGGMLRRGKLDQYTRTAAKVYEIYQVARGINVPQLTTRGHWIPITRRDGHDVSVVAAELFTSLAAALANPPRD